MTILLHTCHPPHCPTDAMEYATTSKEHIMELVAECEDEDGSLDLAHFKELYQEWLSFQEDGGDAIDGDEEDGEGEGEGEHEHHSVSMRAPPPSP